MPAKAGFTQRTQEISEGAISKEVETFVCNLESRGGQVGGIRKIRFFMTGRDVTFFDHLFNDLLYKLFEFGLTIFLVCISWVAKQTGDGF